ncbi:hypothetical protein D3C87_1172040 [compost metagenome]
MLGKVLDGDATAESAVIEFQVDVIQREAGGRTGQPGRQFHFAQAAFGHGREFLTDAVDEFRQIELGNRQAATDLWRLVEVVDLQLTQRTKLVGGNLDAGPLGDVGSLVQQQLALSCEGHGLALQWIASHFTGQFHVFKLVALQCALETQLAIELGAHSQNRLVGAEERGELDWYVGGVMHRTGAELDAFGAELLAGFFVVVLNAGVVDGQAVDVQANRLRRFLRLGGGLRFRFAGGCRRRVRGCRLRHLADVFPVAVAVLVAVQAQVQAFDAHIAHLHFTAQQRQHADRQTEHLQIGERLGGLGQGRDSGVVQFQAQPREQAPADIAIERQLDVGLVAGNLANLVFVVVGIEEVGQGKAQRHNDQQQPEKYQTQDFAERFHGRVLVVSRIRNLAGEYSAPKETTGQ